MLNIVYPQQVFMFYNIKTEECPYLCIVINSKRYRITENLQNVEILKKEKNDYEKNYE